MMSEHGISKPPPHKKAESKSTNESENLSSSEQATLSVASDIDSNEQPNAVTPSLLHPRKDTDAEYYDEYDEYDACEDDDEYLNEEDIKKEPFATHNTSSCSSVDHMRDDNKTGVSSPPDFDSIHPKLKKILKTYRLNARKNIHGPSNYNTELANASPPPKVTHATHSHASDTPFNVNGVKTTNCPAPVPSPFVQGHVMHGHGHVLTRQDQSSMASIVSQQLADATAMRIASLAQRVVPFSDGNDFDNWIAPPPNTTIRRYANVSSDSGRTDKCETVLHGERITCFEVGGEKRLCLAEILNFILKDFTVQQINNVCERLHIYCSRCTNEQLDILKQNRILPLSAPSCGLITLTDAERLCSVLLNDAISKPKNLNNQPAACSSQTLKVCHKCFGRSHGTVHVGLYRKAGSKCIECDTCHLFYSPMNFVSHSHRTEESRICHWGFDSNNWRLYLGLTSVHRDDQRAQVEFDAFKAKYNSQTPTTSQPPQQHVTNNPLKRKSLLDNDNETPTVYDEVSASLWSAHKRLNDSQMSDEDALSSLKVSSSMNLDGALSKKLQKLIGSESKANEGNMNDHKLLNSLLTKTAPKFLNSSQAPIHFTPTLVTASNVNTVNTHKTLESLFDGLQGEIDSSVASVEARKRLTFYMSQIQQMYNEKIVHLMKSQLEQQDAVSTTQHENEALKARIKYLDVENQLLMSGTKSMLAHPHSSSAFGALTRHLYPSPQLYSDSMGLQVSPIGKETSVNTGSLNAAPPSKFFAGKGFALPPFPGQYVNALKCDIMSTQ